MTGKGGKTRVAVLGGGVGAMTAAFELTAPHLEGRYDVTVYQPGWRLGGKCASGRGGPDKRIEEHGLHVWFGFYANAFNMIQRCYDEWKPPEASPIKTWQQAFKQCNDIVLFESWRGRWHPWHLEFPNDSEVPGSGHDVTPWQFLHTLLDWLLSEWQLVSRKTGAPRADRPPARRFDVAWLPRLAAEIGRAFERAYVTHYLEHAFKVAAAHVESPAPGDHRHHHVGWVERLLSDFKHWFFRVALEPWIDDDDVRRFAIMLDFWVTVVTGLVADEVFVRGFRVLNDVDLWKWLRRHGAERLTLEHAAFVQALYDLVFAYRDGDKRRPDLATGKALQAMIRIVSEYKGAVLWKMQAGMGDTVFTPLYDVLRSRGVRFRFFHQVTRLGVSDDGGSVSSITVQPQVWLTRSSYDPIVRVGGLRCWPSEPKWDQLVDGARLQARGVNFENECNPLGLDCIRSARRRGLRRGRARDLRRRAAGDLRRAGGRQRAVQADARRRGHGDDRGDPAVAGQGRFAAGLGIRVVDRDLVRERRRHVLEHVAAAGPGEVAGAVAARGDRVPVRRDRPSWREVAGRRRRAGAVQRARVPDAARRARVAGGVRRRRFV